MLNDKKENWPKNDKGVYHTGYKKTECLKGSVVLLHIAMFSLRDSMADFFFNYRESKT